MSVDALRGADRWRLGWFVWGGEAAVTSGAPSNLAASTTDFARWHKLGQHSTLCIWQREYVKLTCTLESRDG
jgi:hypothetical protein